MLEGAARKVALVLVFVSACGWIVFVTGFGIRDAESGSVVQSAFTSHWLLSVCGVVVHFLYFVHLLWGNAVTAMITLSLVPLYLAVVGAVLQFDSRDTGCDGDFPSLLHEGDFEVHLLVEYIGALLTGLCMWLALVMWPWFKYAPRNNDDYTPINT